MPTMDEGDLIVQLEKLPSINLQQSIAIDQRFQQRLMQEVPEVEGIVARTGSDELGLDTMGLNQTDGFLILKPREQWSVPNKEALIDKVRQVTQAFPGVDFAFTQPLEMRVSEMLTGVRGDLAIKIFGDDQGSLNREGPVAVNRERGRRMAVVIANVGGRDLVGFVEEAKAKVAEQVSLPTGYYLEWGGQFENQQRAATRLSLVIPMVIGLIFPILFSTFRSVRQAVLVLTNIPFAMIGGIAALWLTGEYLSVPASVGFIALLGIAVLNGVVMVSYFNQLKALGRPMLEVVLEGAQRRLRPVLMTANIAAFGLVPLLFASGPGSEIQRPLAIVVIGGLLSSTALTLFLLLILYQRFGCEAKGA